MRFNRLQVVLLAVLLVFGGFTALNTIAMSAVAQSNTTGDLAGTVTDPTGAILPNAKVTVTNKATGKASIATTNASGGFRVSQLEPGDYKVTAVANGFDTSAGDVFVSVGTTASFNFKLTVGKATTTVEVTGGEFQTLHVDDAQITTSFNLEQIQSLPNPGNDLTFVAQTAPGAVMNTQGGYGNFSVNGLPGESNTFTVNGGYEGDPYLNLNNSGASNLTLGNNDVETVSVITNSYDAAFGGLGGAQVNEISRHGGNAIHGNLGYWWNGRALNANDWFTKNAGESRLFDNVNQWAAGAGGPIKKDKLFWFANTEGLRVIIPTTGHVDVPSKDWQNAILAGANSTYSYTAFLPYGNLADNGNQAESALYQKIFAYYNNAKYYANGSETTNPFDSTLPGDDYVFFAQGTNFAKEWIITDRLDYNPSAKDQFFVHSKVDQGTQPTQTSLLSPDFSALSPQPSYEGQLGWNHQFTSNISNSFLFAASYYRAIFTNTNAKTVAANIPFTLIDEGYVSGWNLGQWDSGASRLGGADYAFPQGRNVTGYQFNDDLSWLKGKHALKFGYAFRRDDITDYTSSEHTYANAGGENFILDPGDFAAGYSDEWAERFPQRLSQPVALYVEGFYAQDQWKPVANLTITAGLRVEHNSNPTCETNCFSSLATNFDSASTAMSTPYNTLFNSGRHQAFLSQQNIAFEPRIGFSYQIGGGEGKTVIRGGFGMFANYFPGEIIGDLMPNIPTTGRFTVLGAYFGNGILVDGSLAGSGHDQATISNNYLQQYYSQGACYKGCDNSLYNLTGGVFSRPTTATVDQKIYLPTYEEWNLSLERQLTRGTTLALDYVGNHTYHEPVTRLPNAYSSSGAIASLPTSRPNAALGSVTEYYSGGSSNYNGLIGTLTSRQKWGTLQFNYAYSHALDDGSNGGFNAFGVNAIGQTNPANLHDDYGNADYDTRHYFSGGYSVQIPHFGGPKLLVDHWEIAGTVFANSGYPFSVVDSSSALLTYGNTPRAKQIDNSFDHHCTSSINVLTPCSFAAVDGAGNPIHFAAPTGYNQQGRNQLWGPHYTDVDMDIQKGFALPYREGATFNIGFQFFNLFNHANFAIPGFDISSASTFGLISGDVNTPTSVLGAGLGGNASPRLIQLKATIKF